MTTSNIWNVWIDTGGTFTDCVALSPEGIYLRSKVLSNSTLRGKVINVIDEFSLKVVCGWPVIDDLEIGFCFAILSDEVTPKRHVVECNLSEGIIRLDGPVSEEIAGFEFELKSPQPAPILAAQLVTRCANPEFLPKISMRLGTTRGTNALLEKKGAPLALFVTKGFLDLLEIVIVR